MSRLKENHLGKRIGCASSRLECNDGSFRPQLGMECHQPRFSERYHADRRGRAVAGAMSMAAWRIRFRRSQSDTEHADWRGEKRELRKTRFERKN